MKIILQGVVGSTAYGLNTKNSDQDYLGVFQASTKEVLGLRGASLSSESKVSSNPDSTLHELGKFCSLALKCNPTAIELLWLPAYKIQTPVGLELVNLRQAFLSESYVRSAYSGYALSQAKKLLKRSQAGQKGFESTLAKRTQKHGRHVARLLIAGAHLLTTGELLVNVAKYKDELFSLGELAESDPQAFLEEFQKRDQQFKALGSVLPTHPDLVAVEKFLVAARLSELA